MVVIAFFFVQAIFLQSNGNSRIFINNYRNYAHLITKKIGIVTSQSRNELTSY